MRRNLNWLLINLMLFFLLSCSKKSSDLVVESNSLRQDVKTVMTNIDRINQYSYADVRQYSKKFQKLLFSVMSPSVKARLWKERIADLIASSNDVTKKQSLSELKQLIGEQIFIDKKISIQIEGWIKRNVPVFGYERTKEILMSMDSKETNSSNLKSSTIAPNVVDPGGGGCTCNMADDFCASGYDCTYTGCDYKNSGCGWLWMGPCNGNCRQSAT